MDSPGGGWTSRVPRPPSASAPGWTWTTGSAGPSSGTGINGPMHILVINQYFFPDVASTGQLLTELCEDLAESHDVTVVAGRPSYDPVAFAPGGRVRSPGPSRHGRVRVLRTWSTTFPRRSI